tara:strand:- start:769 stop:1068 length:300 start_codon:yes stop_codon:yes gene_type:complete
MVKKKDPCPDGYRRNRKGRCVPNRSADIGWGVGFLGMVGSIIGMEGTKTKEENLQNDMKKAGLRPGEPIKSGKKLKKEKKGGIVFSRKSRITKSKTKKK